MEQRRFALKHLKDFGFGKIGLQGVIQGEVEDLVQLLSEAQSEDFRLLGIYFYLRSTFSVIFRMESVFGIPVINILWTIVAGRRFQINDPKAVRMMSLLNRYCSLTLVPAFLKEETKFQTVQGNICPGVPVPLVGPYLLLCPRS